jgi:alpha-D-xyloside xylohydrolase
MMQQSNRLRTARTIGLFITLMSSCLSTFAEAPKVEQVAPGVWRLRFGTPEKFTPIHFRSAEPALERMKILPAVQDPPIAAEKISFTVRPRGCALELPMAKDERIYGLGLNTKFFEMSGKRAFIVPSDDPENEANTSHAPVPFYVSSNGYGVFVDTARFASFYAGDVDPASKPPTIDSSGNSAASATGTEDLYRARELRQRTMLVDVPTAQGVDVYLFAGPAMMDVVRRYNLFAGGGCVPPMWGLGMVYRGLGKFTADDSLKLAKSFRDDHMPCDIWGLEPGWQTKAYSCSFVWNTQAFPDPDAFVHAMSAMGYRLNLWEHCFTNAASPIHDAIAPYSGNYRVWSGLVPDFAMPEARKIFIDHHEKEVFSKGISGVKLDECDYQPFRSDRVWSFPEASAFPSGMDGEQMHSMIGVLYQQTMKEPFDRKNLRTWGLVRDSHALASPLPYTVYSDSYDHRCYVRGVAKSGFGGLLWTPEVRNADSIEDFYRRTQTVIFTPFAMLNCWFLKMPPWLQVDRDKNNAGEIMPNHAQVTAATKKLFDVRMSLVPYLYAAFNEYRLNGTPPNRALVLDWPKDPNVATIDDQFMCGPSILVAPMFKGQNERSVYLPKGTWYDFWTDEKYEGGQKIQIRKPPEIAPVFVKGDTLLPLAAPTEHFDEKICYDITVKIYGDHPTATSLYEDDGVSNDFQQGKQNRIELTWRDGEGTVASTGAYTGPKRYNIAAWTKAGAKATTSHD